MNSIDKLFNTFKNQYGKNIGEIRLYSAIGEGWNEDGAVAFNDKLDEMRECDEIHVRINSGGGSVFSGNAIYASLKRFPKPVKVYIDGIAASIASVIMCAGDEVICPSNAIIMIHRPLNQVAGNIDDMKENISILEKVQETIEEAYLNKCGKKLTRDKLRNLLVGEYKDGTWLSAREAQELGMVDIIEHECLVAAKYNGPSNIILNGTNIDLTNFKHTEKLKGMIENKAQPYGNLPLAPRENQWDAPSAQNRVRAFFKCEDKPNAQYKKAFLWYDETKPELFGSYKLPFADVVDGQLKAVYRGLSAAKGRLNQTNISSEDKSKVEVVLRKYYKKASNEYNDPSISYDNKLEETNMSEISKSGLAMMIDNIANSIKSSLGIKAEVEQVAEIEPETQVEQSEEIIAQEENLEVQNEPIQEVPEVVETVAEDTEVQEEIIEPSVEVTEEIEPSTETEPVVTVESEAEIIAETEQPEAQEEPEVVQDEPEVTEEPIQTEEEIEPSPEATVSVPEVSANIDLAKEVANLKAQILDRDTKLAKAELAKEIGNKFRGVPGKLEDKVDLIYELKNSTLSDSSKEMIFKSLENLSVQNLKDCEELGHSEEIIADELTEMEQAKAMSQKEGISEGQALLVMSGKRTLAEAKAVKRK